MSGLDCPEAEPFMANYKNVMIPVEYETPRKKTAIFRRLQLHRVLNVLLSVTILLLGALIFFQKATGDQNSQCRPECCHYYSPALESSQMSSRISHIEDLAPSPYTQGKPEHIDSNWTSLLRVGMMGLSDEELRRVGATRASVRLRPESGGGYMAYLASHHHIHCLYLLYQSLHQDYYATRSVVWDLPLHMRLSHWDHCVDEILQYVKCNADSTVVTHEWIDGLRGPVPNQANARLCANWDAHFQWQLDRQVPAPREPLVNPKYIRTGM